MIDSGDGVGAAAGIGGEDAGAGQGIGEMLAGAGEVVLICSPILFGIVVAIAARWLDFVLCTMYCFGRRRMMSMEER